MDPEKRKTFMSADAPPCIYQQAQILRKYQTATEEKLWGILRKKPGGFKFRRQHPLSLYILDFYCHKAKLAIEIDGKIHQHPLVMLNDKDRETEIRKLGIDIIRFSNERITNDINDVVLEIVSYINRKLSIQE